MENLYMGIDTFNSFIEDRLQNNYSSLLNNSKYVSLNVLYTNKYRDFVSNISAEHKKLFEEIIDIKGNLLSEEIYLSYLIGFHDGFELKKEIQ